MPWWIYYTFLAVLCLTGYTNATTVQRSLWNPSRRNAEKTHSDIIFDKDPVEQPVVGSGGWKLHVSDDEDLVESGSGSGSGLGEIIPDASITTSRPSTPCEKLRQASQQMSGKYIPRCLPNGEFDALQCQGHPGIGDCWCSDLEGRKIPGTIMEAPNVPNCSHAPLQKTTVMTTTTAMTTASTTTSRPSTPCEKLRQASRQLSGKYIPRCLPNGEFDALQCQGHPGIGDCWCSDLEGREIPGSVMEAPNVPNCSSGNNLPSCVHQLVQHVRSKLLGSFRPRCTNDGQFDRVQCHGSMCFCVDEDTGNRMSGTEVHIPDIPNCDDDSVDVNIPEITTETSMPDVKNKNEENIDIDDEVETEHKITVQEENGETIDLDMEFDKKIDNGKGMEQTKPTYEEDNKSNKDTEDKINKSDQEGYQGDKMVKASDIMTQPGILAGIVGGSVVLLLCVVLLVMFIVYRMRKKDEGSYPLDEPRKAPNYNYVRAPEKEFYA